MDLIDWYTNKLPDMSALCQNNSHKIFHSALHLYWRSSSWDTFFQTLGSAQWASKCQKGELCCPSSVSWSYKPSSLETSQFHHLEHVPLSHLFVSTLFLCLAQSAEHKPEVGIVLWHAWGVQAGWLPWSELLCVLMKFQSMFNVYKSHISAYKTYLEFLLPDQISALSIQNCTFQMA